MTKKQVDKKLVKVETAVKTPAPPKRWSRPLPPLPDPSDLPFPGNVIRGCTSCNLCKTCRAPVPGFGPIPAKIMFIGEAPGQTEDEQGIPFIGRAGEQLNALLTSISAPRDTVFITNCVRCRPQGNRDPHITEINACAKWLDLEISIVDPQIIVPMGAFAIRRIMADQADILEHVHGRPVVMEIRGKNRIVLPTYHPAAALYDSSLLRHLFADFEVLRGLNRGKDPSEYLIRDEYPHPIYKIADTPERFREMEEEIRSRGVFAIDVETVDRGETLWSAQISTAPGTGWFIPIPEDQGKVRFDCTHWGAKAIVHYYLNDIKYLDLPDDNFVDTMTQAYLLGHAQGLKTLSSRLCGVKMVSYTEVVRPGQFKLSMEYLRKVVDMEWPDPPLVPETKWDNKVGRIVTRNKKPWHITRKVNKILKDVSENPETDPYVRWFNISAEERSCVEEKLGIMPESSLKDIPFEEAFKYSVRDADMTMRVYEKMKVELQSAGLSLINDIDHDTLPMVREMIESGFALDVELFRNLAVELGEKMVIQAEKAAALAGHPFNPNSSDQVAAVVYGEMGFTPTKWTKTKKISTDDQQLKMVNHEIVKPILEYRRLLKLKSTYAEAIPRLSVLELETNTMRVHTNIKTTRTETGRLACVPLDSEILTFNGWKHWNEIVPGDGVYGFRLSTGQLVPDIVKQIHVGTDVVGKLIFLRSWVGKSSFVEFWCTRQHTWVIKVKFKHKSEFDYVFTTADAVNNYNFDGIKFAVPEIEVPIPVWCPETVTGVWVMRQGGNITITGNSSEPNLQNIPSRSKEGKTIRKGFIATPKGMKGVRQ